MRLPGKWNGHGADVAERAQTGDFAAIDRYDEGDVLNTFAADSLFESFSFW